MSEVDGRYTTLQVPGLPGVFFQEREVELGGRTITLLTASVVDVLGARIQGPTPYWPMAWPAGLGLARHLATLPLFRKSVLELGCGVGLSGLGAAVAGADVLVTDNQVPALRIATMNAMRNELSLRAAVADWRAWPIREQFDLVVGSDVTYEPAAFDCLLDVLDQTVRPGGEVRLTDPGRLMTSAFQQRAQLRRWSWDVTPLPGEGPWTIFLYTLRRT